MNNSKSNPSKPEEGQPDKMLFLLGEKFTILSSNIRLSILLILNTQNKVKITDLVHLFNINSGKLDHHVKILEKDNLIIKKYDIFPKRVRSVIEITSEGKKLLNDYLLAMEEIIKQIIN